jgi:hypothetical protein
VADAAIRASSSRLTRKSDAFAVARLSKAGRPRATATRRLKPIAIIGWVPNAAHQEVFVREQWSAGLVRYPMSGHAQSRRSHGRGLPALTARLRWRVVASSGRHWPYGSRESRYIVQPYCAAPGVGLLFACCKPAKTDEPYKLQASSALKGSFRRQCHALPGHTSRR